MPSILRTKSSLPTCITISTHDVLQSTLHINSLKTGLLTPMFALWVAFGLLTSGCGEEEPELACERGELQTCPCIGGGQGVQMCLENKQGWGQCQCASEAGEEVDPDDYMAGETDVDRAGDDGDEGGSEGGSEGGDEGGSQGGILPPPVTTLPDADLFRPDRDAGHPGFSSPHSNPIGVLPDYSRLYVANTPADTVDVFDAQTGAQLTRIHVGVDPVSIAVRPDGLEVWVSNHVSDTVSVIDTDPESVTHHQVIATIQDVDAESRSTRFDEPVGIAFTGDSQKAYVALSSEDKIAVIDVQSRQVIHRINIRSQDPRAITVAGNRLYVIPFESGNQTQVSGCLAGDIDGDICTFDVEQQNVTGEGYDSDVTKHPNIPDRDLYVFNTDNDQAIETISTLGTLLYGVAATDSGKAFIAMTDARNHVNGRAGTGNPKHSLLELENRAFLNQVGVVDCTGSGCRKSTFELEPLPPQNPLTEEALATPFGIRISDDESTLVVTAAGSNKLFTLDARTGAVLGRVDVGSIPRGVALQSDDDGAPEKAWVYNAVGNSVSMVEFASRENMVVTRTLELDDPTDPLVKLGRSMFNSAKASTSGTFACASCHPDGMSDQLMWNIEAPPCNRPGCTQFQLRSTMPIRGLRDTEPYHWDNVPGNPYTVSNGSSLDDQADPTCDPETSGEYACIRDLVNGGLATSMCDPQACLPGPSGQVGALTEEERHAMSVFLLSVPNAQGRERPFDDRVTEQARAGFFQWNHNNGRMTCGNYSCHAMPLMTRIEQSGQYAVPSFRGITDRFLITNNGRFGGMEHQLRHLPDGPDEKTFAVGAFRLGAAFNLESGYTEQGPWQMFLENAQQGTSGAFARQVTLSADSAYEAQTTIVLDALESVAQGGAIMLRGEGAWSDGTPVALNYNGTAYEDREGIAMALSRDELLAAASAGELVLTLTGRMGQAHEPFNPQPLLWGDAARNGSWTLVEHYGSYQSWGPRTLSLPEVAEGQENLRISFRANGGSWINVSGIQVTANGVPVNSRIVAEVNSVPGDDNHIAYGQGWFTADLDSRGLTNIEVNFTLVSEAPVDVHVSDGGLGLTNITLGTGNSVRIDFPTNAGYGGMQIKGRHIQPDSSIFVDGRRVDGSIDCTLGGSLPYCDEEKITVTLDAVPQPANATCPCPGGETQEGALPDDTMHLLQVQTPGGLLSNEFLIFQ